MPKPMMDESHDEYMDRCMADAGMMEKHPDDADRKVACESVWGKEHKSQPAGRVERRYCPAMVRLEKRGDGKPLIVGHAAVFYRQGDLGTQFELWPGAVERIGHGAFDRAIRERQDVRAMFNHDPNGLLGRTLAETMRLGKDDVGLTYEIEPADTQIAHDVLEHLRRGDLTGSSFSFIARKELWEETDDGRPDIRTILDLDLFDVGPVIFPAYESTTAGVRAGAGVQDARSSWNAWQAQRRAVAAEIEARARHLRLLELSA